MYEAQCQVFPWRGRQTLCKRNPPDQLYNNFVRKITLASTIEDLRRLAYYRTKVIRDKQPAHSEFSVDNRSYRLVPKEFEKKRILPISTTNTKRQLGDVKSNLINDTLNNEQTLKQRHWLNNKNTAGDGSSSLLLKPRARFLAGEDEANNNGEDNLIQLASSLYDEGLLSHLRYLETVGKKRITAERKDGLRSNSSSDSQSLSVLSASNNPNLRFNSNQFGSSHKRIGHTKRPALKRNRKTVSIRNSDDCLLPTTPTTTTTVNSNCRIRVEITTSAASRDSRKVNCESIVPDTRNSTIQKELPTTNPKTTSNLVEKTTVDVYTNSMKSIASNENFHIRSPVSKNGNCLDLITATHDRNENSVNQLINSLYRLNLSELVRSGRLPHQKSLTAQIDLVEDRKTLRDALYQGIFHRHRRTIFAVGSFLRMLRSRNSQYNTIRSSSEGEDIDEVR